MAWGGNDSPRRRGGFRRGAGGTTSAPEGRHGVVVRSWSAQQSRTLVDEEARGGGVAAYCPQRGRRDPYLDIALLGEVVRS